MPVLESNWLRAYPPCTDANRQNKERNEGQYLDSSNSQSYARREIHRAHTMIAKIPSRHMPKRLDLTDPEIGTRI